MQVPTLAPYLDLSLVRSVTYIDDPWKDFSPENVYPTEEDLAWVDVDELDEEAWIPYRLLPSSSSGPTFAPLRIDSLVFLISQRESYTQLWDVFDPVTLRIEGKPHGLQHAKELASFTTPYHQCRWTQLRKATFVDTSGRNDSLFESELFFGLKSVQVEIELSSRWFDENSLCGVKEDARVAAKEDSPFNRVIVKVRNERLKAEILKGFGGALPARVTILVKPNVVSS